MPTYLKVIKEVNCIIYLIYHNLGMHYIFTVFKKPNKKRKLKITSNIIQFQILKTNNLFEKSICISIPAKQSCEYAPQTSLVSLSVVGPITSSTN